MKPMAAGDDREVEIKLPFEAAEPARRRLEQAGFRLREPRAFETNSVYDSADHRLQNAGTLLRLRTAAARSYLTFKGRSEGGKHKTREEIEVQLDDAAAFARILYRLGFQVRFRYEKYRTEFDDGEGRAMLDETPAGVFVELEGPPEWIDRAARRLGFEDRDYITDSYAQLHARSPAGRAGRRDMIFES